MSMNEVIASKMLLIKEGTQIRDAEGNQLVTVARDIYLNDKVGEDAFRDWHISVPVESETLSDYIYLCVIGGGDYLRGINMFNAGGIFEAMDAPTSVYGPN